MHRFRDTNNNPLGKLLLRHGDPLENGHRREPFSRKCERLPSLGKVRLIRMDIRPSVVNLLVSSIISRHLESTNLEVLLDDLFDN